MSVLIYTKYIYFVYYQHVLHQKISQIWSSWKVESEKNKYVEDTLLQSHLDTEWLERTKKATYKCYGVFYLYQCEKNQGLGSTKNENECVCSRCGLNVSSTAAKHHVEALTSSGLVFGDDTFIIRFDEIMKMGPSCEARGRIRRESIEERPCDDTGGRWPSTGQEESSHQNPTMLTP